MTYYPIVFETEESGAVSAYVPGLPVYAAADTQAIAERAIQEALADYLSHAVVTPPPADVRIARVVRSSVRVMGLGAALGARRSPKKAKAARLSGLLGGRPAVSSTARAGRTVREPMSSKRGARGDRKR
jgi:hypothetical protein